MQPSIKNETGFEPFNYNNRLRFDVWKKIARKDGNPAQSAVRPARALFPSKGMSCEIGSRVARAFLQAALASTARARAHTQTIDVYVHDSSRTRAHATANASFPPPALLRYPAPLLSCRASLSFSLDLVTIARSGVANYKYSITFQFRI